MAKLFLKFNWTSCVVIYQNDAFGIGGANAINKLFIQYNLTVTERIIFDVATHTIRGDLKSILTNSPIRIIILWAESTHASLILQNVLDADVLGPQFTWILSSSVPLNSFDQTLYPKLIGMLTLEPLVGSLANAPINKTLLNAAYDIWQTYEPESFPGADSVDYYALFAFDAAWTLIQALQQFCSTTTTNGSSSCISMNKTSFCFDRRFLNSRSFIDKINTNTFLGVSGPVEFSANVTDRTRGIYYVVKNVQESCNNLNYVPVLVWSDSGDWSSHTQTNTIIWPGKSLTASTCYAAITGVTLRIAIIEAAPFTMMTEVIDKLGHVSKKPVGYIPDLIDNLQKRVGFIPQIIYLPSNQTYNGLIDAVANNVYDMVIGDVTMLAARREKIAFTPPIFDNSLRIIVRNTFALKIDFWAFLRPFAYIIWIIMLAFVLCSGILLCFFERLTNKSLRKKPLICQLRMGMWYSVTTLLGHSMDLRVKTAAARVLIIAMMLMSFVSMATYQANLTSNLTIAKTQNIVSGIDDIKNGRLPFSRIGIITDSSIEDFYLREVTAGSRNFYPLKSKEEMYAKLLDNTIDAAIMDGGVLEYTTTSVYCNLTLTGKPFDYSTFGIVLPKKWIYAENFDVNILKLRDDRIFDDLKVKWFQSNKCLDSRETSTEWLVEEIMYSLYAAIALMIFVALILHLLRNRCIKYYRSKSIEKDCPSGNQSTQTSRDSVSDTPTSVIETRH